MSYNFPLASGGLQSYIRRTDGNAINGGVVNYATANESAGTDITYVPDAGLGDSFLINVSGIYAASSAAIHTNAATEHEIKVSVGPYVAGPGDAATRNQQVSSGAVRATQVAWAGFVNAGESIWVFLNDTPVANTNGNQVTIA